MISFSLVFGYMMQENNRMKFTAIARLARAFSLMSIVVAITLDGSLVLANENDALITAARKYVSAHSAVSKFDVSVEKIEGDYARVKVTPKHAGETDPPAHPHCGLAARNSTEAEAIISEWMKSTSNADVITWYRGAQEQ